MAKFPTEVTVATTVAADVARTYAFLCDVAGSAGCIPGIDRCEPLGNHVYRFVYQERSTGPVSMVVCYTAAYSSNGHDEIRFRGTGDPDDNTDVEGVIRLRPDPAGGTHIELWQAIAPDTPVPRLLQGFIKSFVQREAAGAAAAYLANVERALAGT
jgi:hypothetical protein